METESAQLEGTRQDEFDPLAVEIGDKIAHYRRKRGLAQNALGGIVGVSHETMRSIERGKYPPRSDVLVKIAAVLGIPVEQFMPQDYLERFNPLVAFAAQVAALQRQRNSGGTPSNDSRIMLKARNVA